MLCSTVPFISAKKTNPYKAISNPQKLIDADAYMLVAIDKTGHSVLAQRNMNKIKYPASLTKIVTAMVTINRVKDLKKKTRVSARAVEVLEGTGSQIAYLREGDVVSFEELLYLAMLFSACDACQVLGEAVGGNIKNFTKLMNEWVRSIGCKNTHFVNPDGLHDDNHYSTASDIARISLAALKNKEFVKISTSTSFYYNGSTFYHTNRMLHEPLDNYYYPYAKGIKTGYTKQADHCLVTTAQRNGVYLLAVILDSPLKKIKDEWIACSYLDAKKLFKWGFSRYLKKVVVAQNEAVDESYVLNGKNACAVKLVSAAAVESTVPEVLERDAITVKALDPPDYVKAPLKKNQPICKARIYCNNQPLGTVDLVCAQDVEENLLSHFSTRFDESIAQKPAYGFLALLLMMIFV